jgi:hypothetical protein
MPDFKKYIFSEKKSFWWVYVLVLVPRDQEKWLDCYIIMTVRTWWPLRCLVCLIKEASLACLIMANGQGRHKEFKRQLSTAPSPFQQKFFQLLSKPDMTRTRGEKKAIA